MKKAIIFLLMVLEGMLVIVLPKPINTIVPLFILVPLVVFIIIDAFKNGNK